jgi:hypothetical protein
MRSHGVTADLDHMGMEYDDRFRQIYCCMPQITCWRPAVTIAATTSDCLLGPADVGLDRTIQAMARRPGL